MLDCNSWRSGSTKIVSAHQLYEIPPGILSSLSEYVQRVSDVPNFDYLLAFIGGLTFGTWIDAILRGTECRQSEKYAALADKAGHLTEAIQIELGNVNRQRDHASASLLAEVNALMLDLRRARIPVPFWHPRIPRWRNG